MRTASFTLALSLALAAAPAGAQVCDLSELATVATGGSPSQPAIGGTLAFVAAGSAGVIPIDISDPTQPSAHAAQPTQGEALDVTLDFFADLIGVADGTAGFSVYSFDTSGTLLHQGSHDLGQPAISVVGFSGSYLVGGQNGTLFAVTLGGNNFPSVDGSVALGGPVRGIVQQGQTAYCAVGNAGLAIVDVSDRAHPALVRSVDLGGDVLSVAREGTNLYAGVEGVGLVSLHLAGGDATPLASLMTTAAPTRLTAWLGRVYMVAPSVGVMLADASLGTDLLLLDELPLSGANGVALVGSFLCIGRGSAGFSTVDLSDCSSTGIKPTTRFIAAAARATGLENTFWVTDLAIANFTPSAAVFNIAYLAKDQANSTPDNRAFSLQSGQQVMIRDVFDSVFGLEGANGALRVTTSHPDVRVTSRTFNAAGASGTYGQFIPAQDRIEALGAGEQGALLQLQEGAAFRSNVGLLNVTAGQVEVSVSLYLGSGALVGTWTRTLRPYEMVQATQIFVAVGAGTVDNGFAVVEVLTSGGEVMAFASVVDNGSGDPVFIPLQNLTSSF